MQDFLRVLHALVARNIDVLKRVFKPQSLPFELPEHVVRKHLDTGYVPELADKLMDPRKLLVAVGVSGHEHMPDPHLCPELIHVFRAREDVLVRDAGELLVLRGVDVLDVEHHEIGAPHQPVKGRKPLRIVIERPARGVEAGVDAVLL